MTLSSFFFFFFFNDPATTEIYTLSLHDALPISSLLQERVPKILPNVQWMDEEQYLSWSFLRFGDVRIGRDRKSTRLNSSHLGISYAVFCLKKKKQKQTKMRNREHQTYK